MKKRLLAMALVLIMALTLLPASALAVDTMREMKIVFQTADVKDAGTNADVWVEIEYEDGTYWGTTRDETPYLDHDGTDFDRGATDTYSFYIPDKTVRYYRIVKDGGNDWLLDYVLIDGVKYDAPKDWLQGDTFFMIRPENGGEKFCDLNVVFQTADEASAGTDDHVWIEIDYEDGTHWGSTRSETPDLDNPGNDFERSNRDEYTFSIPDKAVKSYTIVKKGGDDWKLFSVEFNGKLYKVDSWLKDDARYTISVDTSIGSYRDFTAEFYTANVTDAGTDKDVWIEIEYEDGTFWGVDNRDETPYLDHSGTDFDRGATDTYTFSILDKPIKKYTIRTDGGNAWLLDGITLDGVSYAVPDYWLEDKNASFTIEVGVTPQTQSATLDIETGSWDEGGTDGKVYAIFYVKDLETGELKTSKKYYLDNDGNDFEKNQTDRYTLYGIPAGTILYFDIDFTAESTYNDDRWDMESASLNGVSVKVHHTFMEKEEYRVFVDSEAVERTITITTGKNGTDNDVRVKFAFVDGTETSYINLDKPGNDFEANSHDSYVLWIPNKEVATITIKLFSGKGVQHDPWELSSFVFDSVSYKSTLKTFEVGDEEEFAHEMPGTGSAFSDINAGMIIGIGVPVIVIAAAAVVLVLRKKKKNSADTAE